MTRANSGISVTGQAHRVAAAVDALVVVQDPLVAPRPRNSISRTISRPAHRVQLDRLVLLVGRAGPTSAAPWWARRACRRRAASPRSAATLTRSSRMPICRAIITEAGDDPLAVAAGVEVLGLHRRTSVWIVRSYASCCSGVLGICPAGHEQRAEAPGLPRTAQYRRRPKARRAAARRARSPSMETLEGPSCPEKPSPSKHVGSSRRWTQQETHCRHNKRYSPRAFGGEELEGLRT